MKIFSYLLIAFSLTGCFLIKKYQIDQVFYDQNISKSYLQSKEKCFSSVKKALEYQGFQIEYENKVEGKIVSNRKSYDVNASTTRTVASTGSSYSNGPVTTYHTETSNYVARESHQYYLNITGDTSSCNISAFRWRAWNGAEEMKELQAAGIEWARNNLFAPFFNEVERFLEDRPY